MAFYSSKGHTHESEAVDHVPKPNQEMHRTKKMWSQSNSMLNKLQKNTEDCGPHTAVSTCFVEAVVMWTQARSQDFSWGCIPQEPGRNN